MIDTRPPLPRLLKASDQSLEGPRLLTAAYQRPTFAPGISMPIPEAKSYAHIACAYNNHTPVSQLLRLTIVNLWRGVEWCGSSIHR